MSRLNKKNIVCKYSVVVILLTLINYSNLYAIVEHDDAALVILDNVSSYYKSLESFKAEFTFAIKNKEELYEIMEKCNGEITIKGENYRLKIANQEIVKNNDIIWTYIKENNEITIVDYDVDNEELNLNKLYNLYKEGYSSTYVGESLVNGKLCYIIDLTPENNNELINKVRFIIDKNDYIIVSWEVHTDDAIVEEYVLNSFIPNVDIKEGYFDIEAGNYKDVVINDLR